MKKIIKEVCLEKGIEIITLSYDWVIILKKGDIEKKIVNYKLHLNPKRAVELARDKYSTYAVLNYYHIPVIPHNVLFNEELIPNCSEINNEFAILKNDERVVIKANDSNQGKDVYLCENEAEKFEIVKQIFLSGHEAISVCPYMDIEYEYRAIFLYGEIIYIYKKQKPHRIDENGNIKYTDWKHNLSQGATPIIIDENDLYYKEVKSIAEKAGKALDLNYATIDIAQTTNQELYVMEANSNVCIPKFCELVPNGFEIGKEIYSKVIDKLFEK